MAIPVRTSIKYWSYRRSPSWSGGVTSPLDREPPPERGGPTRHGGEGVLAPVLPGEELPGEVVWELTLLRKPSPASSR